MKKILSVLIAAILIINISGCNSSKKNPSNQTIYYNLESDPESLDIESTTTENKTMLRGLL